MTEDTKELELELDSMIKMRRSGASYRDIGQKFSMSHEKVRTVLTRSGADLPQHAHTFKRQERKKVVEELSQWLADNGPASRARIHDVFGLSNKEINALVQEGVPGHLILASARDSLRDTPESDVIESLQRAWKTVQKTAPDVEGLSHTMYEQVRHTDGEDLSAARITSRYGWVTACKMAGVPSGPRLRPTASYTHQWSEDQIREAVQRYVGECVKQTARPTYVGYDRWQRTEVNAPSGSLVRLRMGKLGYRTWPEIVEAALES